METPQGYKEAGMQFALFKQLQMPKPWWENAEALIYKEAIAETGSCTVTVDRRIAPPTAAPERRVKVSLHTAPQYGDACHAYLPGDVPLAPGSSHHGNVHVRLAGWHSESSG